MRMLSLMLLSTLALTSTPADAADAVAGEAKFKQLCGTCHGDSGKGDGAAAAGLPVKPRNFADAQWQTSVDDDYLVKVIQQGGAAVGKSPMMTPFGHSLNDDQTRDIIAYIRGLD